MKHRLIAAFGTLLVVASAAVLPTVTRADDPGEKAPGNTPGMSLAQARELALKRIPGTILDQELEKEDGQWIYTFDIRPSDTERKIIEEVHVDPDTGEILGVETEQDRS